jgi:hypothetical protein
MLDNWRARSGGAAQLCSEDEKRSAVCTYNRRHQQSAFCPPFMQLSDCADGT